MLKLPPRSMVAVMTFVAAFCTSSGADTLVVGSNQIRTIDTVNGQELGVLKLGEVVTDLAFSPDGSTIFVASSGGKGVPKGGVLEVDAATLQVRRRLTENPVRALQLTDGRTLFALEWQVRTEAGKRVAAPFRLCHLDLTGGGAVTRVDPLTSRIYDFHVAPDAARVFALNLETDSLQIHDSSGKLIDRIAVGRVPKNDPRAPMTSIAPLRTTAKGELIILKSGTRGEVLCVDMGTLKVVTIEIPHGMKARDCVVTDDGLLIIDAVRHLYVIDLAAKKEVASTELPYTSTRIALSNDGQEIFLTGGSLKAGSRECVVQVLRSATLELVRHVTTPISPWVMGVLPDKD